MRSGENQVKKRLKGPRRTAKPSNGVITAMKNELRTHILVLLNERAASGPEIQKELGAPPERVRYELQALRTAEPPLIKLEYERPVRGTVEKFYRATSRAYLDQSEWLGVPDAIKGDMRGTLLNMIVEDAIAALEEGTFDSLVDAHMSWNPAILDQTGWEAVVAVLRRALEEVEQIKRESAERLQAEDVAGVSCTVSILGYASANDGRKVGPPTDPKGLAEDLKQRNMRQPGQGRKRSTRDGKRKAAGKRKRKK